MERQHPQAPGYYLPVGRLPVGRLPVGRLPVERLPEERPKIQYRLELELSWRPRWELKSQQWVLKHRQWVQSRRWELVPVLLRMAPPMVLVLLALAPGLVQSVPGPLAKARELPALGEQLAEEIRQLLAEPEVVQRRMEQVLRWLEQLRREVNTPGPVLQVDRMTDRMELLCTGPGRVGGGRGLDRGDA
jgi:hypothetical protein